MIALVGTQPSKRQYASLVVVLNEVPRHSDYDGLGVHCATRRMARRALEWRNRFAASYPPRPLLLVIPAGWDPMRIMGDFHTSATAILYENRMRRGSLPSEFMDFLLGGVIVRRLYREIEIAAGSALTVVDKSTLFQVMIQAAHGQSTEETALVVGMSRSTLARWCQKRGFVAPGKLLRIVRTEAAIRLRGTGVPSSRVALYGGWKGVNPLHKALQCAERWSSVADAVLATAEAPSAC